jgi:hypothetical protein
MKIQFPKNFRLHSKNTQHNTQHTKQLLKPTKMCMLRAKKYGLVPILLTASPQSDQTKPALR